ncbi:UNVERIFIED_CONTAM: putative protein phosphatase 2C 58 [Sesamum latifolium]|uniref:PPM-type phosphatase domain-containing protein n=1 Tax=Sesamum latifolium TaxID=2727402 RepID=A0AAW2WWH2_9LAMI
MEDCLVSEFKIVDDNELGLFAIFDGHMGHDVAKYLQGHLFDNILKQLGKGGSTAVTAILINGHKLVVANVGDSRAVICRKGAAKQLSVDHEPSKERQLIERKGGFVSNIPVARAFGDKSLKRHLSSEPDIAVEIIDDDVEFIILASDGLWKVMSNQEAVDSIRSIKDSHSAAKRLIDEAISRKSKDDISCIVVRFH